MRTVCLLLSINTSLLWAYAHHSKNTNPDFWSESFLMTASVNCCRPISLWEFASSFLTVRLALSKKTPCCAHFVRSQALGTGIQRSDSISLKIFWSEGGFLIHFWTEKQRPCASPTP